MSVKIKDRDMGWRRIKQELALARKAYVNIGILSDAGVHEGNEKSKKSITYAEIASIQEFGNKTNKFYGHHAPIPARPFMRMTFDKNKRKIKQTVEVFLDRIYSGIGTAKQGLKRLGLEHQSDVQTTIESGRFKANAPATKDRKGSSKPLIDSGNMKNKISFELKGV